MDLSPARLCVCAKGMGHGKGDPCLAMWGSGERLQGWRRPGRWHRAAAPTCFGRSPSAGGRRRQPSPAENSPMATGTEKGVEVGKGAQENCVGAHCPASGGGQGGGGELTPVQRAPSLIQAAHGPAACYRELSRFPAVTRASLRAAAGGQTFLLYTGEWRARPPPCLWPAGPV